MANNANNDKANNQEIGRDLYNRDSRYNQGNSSQRYAPRGDRDRERNWDEGNYFHTGPSPRGAQDRYRSDSDHDYRNRDRDSNRSSYNQGQNAHLNDHYGSRPNSNYRNERSFLNHGDRGTSNYEHDERHSMRRPHTSGGSLQGNHDDVNTRHNDPWREGPGSASRYKESDYRYGSGSHNWYTENRYTPNDEDQRRHQHDDRGFMDRMKDTWNDIWHSDDRDYEPRNRRHRSEDDHLDTRRRYGSENYRDRDFDRGYEGGPRWADESDSEYNRH